MKVNRGVVLRAMRSPWVRRARGLMLLALSAGLIAGCDVKVGSANAASDSNGLPMPHQRPSGTRLTGRPVR